MYVEGTAVVMGFEDPMLQTDDTPIKRCLQTKWPCIELLWTTERSPSLNWVVWVFIRKIVKQVLKGGFMTGYIKLNTGIVD